MKPTLSILICTINGREDDFDYIYARLEMQIKNAFLKNEVNLLSLKDDCTMSVGEKRNRLYAMAQTTHCQCMDDDDDAVPDFIEIEYNALLQHPEVDCIGFNLIKTTNGKNLVNVRHSLNSDKLSYNAELGIFDNPINHINIVKRSIAIKHKFPHIDCGEDQAWAAKIYPDLKTTHFINKVLYHYRFDTNKTAARKDENRF